MSEHNNGDWFNDFMEYKMSSSNSSDENNSDDDVFPTLSTPNGTSYRSTSAQQTNSTYKSSHSSTSDNERMISTIILLFVVLSFFSGNLPINGVTCIIALICAGILLFRLMCG